MNYKTAFFIAAGAAAYFWYKSSKCDQVFGYIGQYNDLAKTLGLPRLG